MMEKDRNKIDDRSFYFSKIMPIKNKILIIINEEFFLFNILKKNLINLFIYQILVSVNFQYQLQRPFLEDLLLNLLVD